MKKLIVLCVIMPMQNVSFANTNNITYCPNKIECTRSDDIHSCRVVGDSKTYPNWQINNSTASRVEAGTYSFEKVASPYQQPHDNLRSTTCYYGFKVNSKITKYIYVSGDDLEVALIKDKANKWSMNVSENDGVVANCYSNEALACPLLMVK